MFRNIIHQHNIKWTCTYRTKQTYIIWKNIIQIKLINNVIWPILTFMFDFIHIINFWKTPLFSSHSFLTQTLWTSFVVNMKNMRNSNLGFRELLLWCDQNKKSFIWHLICHWFTFEYLFVSMQEVRKIVPILHDFF